MKVLSEWSYFAWIVFWTVLFALLRIDPFLISCYVCAFKVCFFVVCYTSTITIYFSDSGVVLWTAWAWAYLFLVFMSLEFPHSHIHQYTYVAVLLALCSCHVLIGMCFSATHMNMSNVFFTSFCVNIVLHPTVDYVVCNIQRFLLAASRVKVTVVQNTKVEIRSDDLNDVYYMLSWCQRHKWKRTFWTKKSLLVPVSEWVADFQWYWWTRFAPMSPFLIFQSLLCWLFVFHSMKKEQAKFHVRNNFPAFSTSLRFFSFRRGRCREILGKPGMGLWLRQQDVSRVTHSSRGWQLWNFDL